MNGIDDLYLVAVERGLDKLSEVHAVSFPPSFGRSLDGGNTIRCDTAPYLNMRCNRAISSGKWYYEVQVCSAVQCKEFRVSLRELTIGWVTVKSDIFNGNMVIIQHRSFGIHKPIHTDALS